MHNVQVGHTKYRLVTKTLLFFPQNINLALLICNYVHCEIILLQDKVEASHLVIVVPIFLPRKQTELPLGAVKDLVIISTD